MELTASTKFLHSIRLQKISVEKVILSLRELSRFKLFLSQATRNKCFGAEIKVKIVNHMKPWKLKEAVTAVFILINLQDNSKMSCLICLNS